MEQREPTPVRVMLESISDQTAPEPRPRGWVSPDRVDQVTRLAAIISVITTSITLLSMIWGGVDYYTGMKIIGSIAVVMLAITIFRSVNTLFG